MLPNQEKAGLLGFHFLCYMILTDSQTATGVKCRRGRLSNIARRGIEERLIPRDHINALHESSLPEMVDAIRKWCGA